MDPLQSEGAETPGRGSLVSALRHSSLLSTALIIPPGIRQDRGERVYQ